MSDREYMSPDKAADRLGWKGTKRGHRLIRVMLAKERRLGSELMHRHGGEGHGHRYGITWPVLRKHCRELFLKPPQELLVEFRKHIASLDERIADIVETQVAPQLEELRAADDELAQGLGRLAEKVDSLTRKSAQECPRVPTVSHGVGASRGHG